MKIEREPAHPERARAKETILEDEQGPILAPGTEMAPGYEVIAHLRRGKRLDVYDVWSTERVCRCIAKTITPDRLDEESARRKLVAEGELLCRFTHPNIVRAYEIATATDAATPVVIMETLTGRTLGRLLDDVDDGLDVTDAAWLGLHICSAVSYLHLNRVLHLDLKPDNVVCEQGRAKVIDLSIAGPPGPSRPGQGTYDYLSPEQARGENVTSATDVWGIGVTLFETLTGSVPFDDHDDDEDEDDEDENGESDEAEESTYDSDGDSDDYPQAALRAPSIGEVRALPQPFVALVDACLEPAQTDRPGLAEIMSSLAEAGGIDPRAPQDDGSAEL